MRNTVASWDRSQVVEGCVGYLLLAIESNAMLLTSLLRSLAILMCRLLGRRAAQAAASMTACMAMATVATKDENVDQIIRVVTSRHYLPAPTTRDLNASL
jgi:hypothetical protein